MGDGGDRGGVLQGSWERFHLARTRLQFRDDFDRIKRSNSLKFLPRSHHDRATIAPRSGHDRASIVILELRQSSSAQVGSIPRQKTCDRGSIAPRSRLDRSSIGPRSWGSSMPCLRRPMMLQLDERSQLI